MLNFYGSLPSRYKVLFWVVVVLLLVALFDYLGNAQPSAGVSVIAAFAAAASAIVAVHAVQVQNRNARATLNITLMQHLREEFSSEGMKRHRKNAALSLLQPISPQQFKPQQMQEIFLVTNFFDKMGALVGRGEIVEESVYLEFQFPLYAYWHKCKPIADYGRSTLRDPAILVNMEALYERVLTLDIEETNKYGGLSARGSFDEQKWQSWATTYLKDNEASL